MRLVPNWKQILINSHAMRANIMGICILIFPELFFVFMGIDTNPRLWWILAIVVLAYGSFGRLIRQGIEHEK